MESESFLKNCLSSGSKVSSKRVATFVALMTWVICILVELFTDKEISANTMDTLMYIVGTGIGFTASEKFGRKDTEKKELLELPIYIHT